MELFEPNQNYKLVLKIDGQKVTFTGKIISETKDFFKFIDKFGETLGYSKACLIHFKELK